MSLGYLGQDIKVEKLVGILLTSMNGKKKIQNYFKIIFDIMDKNKDNYKILYYCVQLLISLI